MTRPDKIIPRYTPWRFTVLFESKADAKCVAQRLADLRNAPKWQGLSVAREEDVLVIVGPPAMASAIVAGLQALCEDPHSPIRCAVFLAYTMDATHSDTAD